MDEIQALRLGAYVLEQRASSAGPADQVMLGEASRKLRAMCRQPPAATIAPVYFVWLEPRVFTVDGVPLCARGSGVAIAWALLAGFTLRLPPLPADAFGSPSSVLNRLTRAADAIERVSRPLAATVRTLGAAGGLLAPRAGHLPASVVCRSPWLRAAAVKST